MIKPNKNVSFKETRQEELVKLQQTIKESVHQRKLKELKKQVQRYFLMLRPKPRLRPKGVLNMDSEIP
jgi:hypothetical protein